MANYEFYANTYLGGSIPQMDFSRLAARAEAQIAVYERDFSSVTEPTANSRDMAICAIADSMYYFETMQSTPQSSSIGSVSSSQKTVDISPKAQAQEYFRCAKTYLEIERGVE